jgi:hypothetical protein
MLLFFSQMNERDKFALMPRPPGALEKAVPGAKRIISGIVADTLALVKRESPNERVLSVLSAGSLEHWCECVMEMLIVEPVNVTVEHCEQMGALSKTLERRKFDLAFVYLHLFCPLPPKEQQSTDARETLDRVGRLPKDAWISSEGLLTIELLRRVHGIPVVALTGNSADNNAEMTVKQAGAAGLFYSADPDLQPVVECLQGIECLTRFLKTAGQRRKTRPLRIILA